MSRIKKLTPEEESTRDGLEWRILQLYREKRSRLIKIQEIEERIDHLEKQVSNVGGPGMDISRILNTKSELDFGKEE
jgi:hypothetical protein